MGYDDSKFSIQKLLSKVILMITHTCLNIHQLQLKYAFRLSEIFICTLFAVPNFANFLFSTSIISNISWNSKFVRLRQNLF